MDLAQVSDTENQEVCELTISFMLATCIASEREKNNSLHRVLLVDQSLVGVAKRPIRGIQQIIQPIRLS